MIHKMAKLAQSAYLDNGKTTKIIFKKIGGYTGHKFFDIDGAQCHAVWDKENYVLCFRGTEPSEVSDILADLNAIPRGSETKGWVHSGFRNELDKLWESIVAHLNSKTHQKKKLYITGHSLGAAMSTIATSRIEQHRKVEGLYTFGSPRAGTRKFVKAIETPHYRVVNNNDIVTSVPFWLMGYRHHGILTYINYYGNVRKMSLWQRIKDKWRGRWKALKKKQPFDGAYDHSMTYYVEYTKGL